MKDGIIVYNFQVSEEMFEENCPLLNRSQFEVMMTHNFPNQEAPGRSTRTKVEKRPLNLSYI